MPRKRTTRLQPVSKPKPNNVAVAENMSESERKEQLEIFLRDYDCRVKNTLKDIEKKKRAMTTFIQTRYETLISDLPAEIKDMTLEDFARCGGTIEAALAHVRGATGDDNYNKRIAELQKWVENGLEDIKEEGGDDTVSASAKPTATRIKRIQGKAPRTQARNKALFVTPSSTASHPIWGQTPLITPKFNPYLPVTPENIRSIKPGERAMSVAGSPLQVRVEGSTKSEIVEKWSSIPGVDLTPGRIEKMLKVVSDQMNAK